MKAQERAWCEGTRIKLADVLPLQTPITVNFEASSLCNLKCSYCIQANMEKRFPQQLMDFDVFRKAVDSLTGFSDKINNIVFSLNGEPFTNPRLPDMIRYIKEKNVAEKVTVFTNAVLMNKTIGREVIDAGLDILRISIQGVSAEQYLTLCNTRIDYEGLLSNISSMYEYKERSRKDCHIFIKVVDQSLRGEADRRKFYDDFGDICDQISLETIVPIRIEVDYDGQEVSHCENLVKQRHQGADVCPQPFYGMYVRSDGTVIACCIADIRRQVIGKVPAQGLPEIWRSRELRDIRKQQLQRKRYENCECTRCSYPDYGIQTNDNIDAAADDIFRVMFGGNR